MSSQQKKLDFEACKGAGPAPSSEYYTTRRDEFIAMRFSSVSVLEAKIWPIKNTMVSFQSILSTT